MNKYLKFMPFFLILSALNSPIVLAQEEAKSECANVLTEIQARKTTLSKMTASLNSLLGSGTIFDTPVDVLFQVYPSHLSFQVPSTSKLSVKSVASSSRYFLM